MQETLDLGVQDDGVSIGTVSISAAGAFTFTTVGGTEIRSGTGCRGSAVLWKELVVSDL